MAVINYSKKEISAKIVYYGPSLCGKTTNIQAIYQSVKPDQKGKLVSLATEADRTLFFDFLPIEIANIRGFKTRLHFYTVPGQVYYNSTRRAVLTGVDGLVFVADSQRDKMEENTESLANLEENLNYYGKSIRSIPLVIQYNKRDLPAGLPVSEMNQILNPEGYPFTEAVATTGEGVLETLTRITKMVLQHIEKGTSGKAQQPPRMGPAAAAPASDRPAPEAAPVHHAPVHPHTPPQYESTAHETHGAHSGSRAEVAGGRIQIVGTGNAEVISANAFSIPVHVKIEGDNRVFVMDMAIKLDRFIPEG